MRWLSKLGTTTPHTRVPAWSLLVSLLSFCWLPLLHAKYGYTVQQVSIRHDPTCPSEPLTTIAPGNHGPNRRRRLPPRLGFPMLGFHPLSHLVGFHPHPNRKINPPTKYHTQDQHPPRKSHRRPHPLQPRRPHQRRRPLLQPPHPLPARRRLDRSARLPLHRPTLQQRKHVERHHHGRKSRGRVRRGKPTSPSPTATQRKILLTSLPTHTHTHTH